MVARKSCLRPVGRFRTSLGRAGGGLRPFELRDGGSHLGARPDDRGVRAIEPPSEVDEEELGAERQKRQQAELRVHAWMAAQR